MPKPRHGRHGVPRSRRSDPFPLGSDMLYGSHHQEAVGECVFCHFERSVAKREIFRISSLQTERFLAIARNDTPRTASWQGGSGDDLWCRRTGQIWGCELEIAGEIVHHAHLAILKPDIGKLIRPGVGLNCGGCALNCKHLILAGTDGEKALCSGAGSCFSRFHLYH
jgi:hypothetical protein